MILGEWGTCFYYFFCSNYYLDLSDLPELKKFPDLLDLPDFPDLTSRIYIRDKIFELSSLWHANRAQLEAGLSWRGGCNFVIGFSRKKEKKEEVYSSLQDPFLCFLSILSCSWVSRAAGERLTLYGKTNWANFCLKSQPDTYF